MDLQISCINKTNRQDPHDRIHSAGGVNSDGTRWKKSQTTVISEIEGKVNTFYTRVNGVRANVIVAVHSGNKYIKTENDGLHPNNLLSLPECP
jgi:hypothetical protein